MITPHSVRPVPQAQKGMNFQEITLSQNDRVYPGKNKIFGF
jgi:hypothetical protein